MTQSLLETVLRDVHATLTELVAAAHEQYASLAAGDHRRLESVTSHQERLSAQLERFERKRIAVLAGKSLNEAIADLPRDAAQSARELNDAIAAAVRDLQALNRRTTSLLQRSIELTSQTLHFMQRIVTGQPAAYGRRGVNKAMQSLLVDSRA